MLSVAPGPARRPPESAIYGICSQRPRVSFRQFQVHDGGRRQRQLHPLTVQPRPVIGSGSHRVGLRESVVRLDRLQTIRTTYQAIADTERNRIRMEQVLDFLFMQPVLSVRQLQTFLNVSFPIAQRYIDRLVDAGVLQEVTGQSRNRIFRANEIFQALEGLE